MELSEGALPAGKPFLAAVDLQDNLLMVANDLERLQTLLGEACDMLLAGFCGASQQLHELRAPPGSPAGEVDRAIAHLSQAVVALQFQDMASQLITHTHQRLRHCTDSIAHEALVDDEDEDDSDVIVAAAPSRPNPVTQDEMDAGSVDLF